MRAIFVVVFALLSMGAGKDVLTLLPADSEVVIDLDVGGSRGEPTYERLIALIGQERLDAIAAAGVDLTKDVQRITVGGKSGAVVVVVDGKLGKIKKGATKKKHRGVAYWVENDQEAMLIGKKRIVFAGAGMMEGVIDRLKKKAKGLATAAEAAVLRAVIAATDTARDGWVAVAGAVIAGKGLNVEGLSVSADFGAAMAVQIRGFFPTDQEAESIEKLAQGQWTQVQPALEQFGLADTARSLAMKRAGRTLQLDATIPDAELEKLLGMASML